MQMASLLESNTNVEQLSANHGRVYFSVGEMLEAWLQLRCLLYAMGGETPLRGRWVYQTYALRRNIRVLLTVQARCGTQLIFLAAPSLTWLVDIPAPKLPKQNLLEPTKPHPNQDKSDT